ncbi:unnamed protein product [Pylaiella littoralis]
MDVPAYGRSPPQEEAVSFAEDVPFLVARHDRTHWIEDSNSGRGPNNVVAAVEDITPRKGTTTTTLPGEEEDDSLAVVFSSDTGAGRAHTPQRLNRTHTPQRLRSSSFLHTAVAPVQQSSATRAGAETRRQPLGRRKQRRWENDNLLGVEKFLRGRHAHDEGEAAHLTVSHPWRSSLADLVSDQNKSTAAEEVRESIRRGVQPRAPQSGGEGRSSSSGWRRYAGGQWEDAEERFLLVERRLRDIVVRALRSSALLTFVRGLETLLEGFVQGKQVPSELPAALRSALASRPTVELATGESAADAGATLLVPVGPSPFHRLLLHALCQYRKLRSRSEETSHGRIVRVTIPTSGTILGVLDASLTDFVLETRLRTGDGSRGADAGRGTVSQASAGAAATRCGREELAQMTTTVAGVA